MEKESESERVADIATAGVSEPFTTFPLLFPYHPA